jgi:hypothetical protein
MSTTCENNNTDNEMDSFSIARRNSEHCFYQNRGTILDSPMTFNTDVLFHLSSNSAAVDR